MNACGPRGWIKKLSAVESTLALVTFKMRKCILVAGIWIIPTCVGYFKSDKSAEKCENTPKNALVILVCFTVSVKIFYVAAYEFILYIPVIISK